MTAILQEPATGSGNVTDAVVLAPEDSTRNIIEGVGDVVPLTLRAETGQTNPLLVLRDENGSAIYRSWQTGATEITINDVGSVAGIYAHVIQVNGTPVFGVPASSGNGQIVITPANAFDPALVVKGQSSQTEDIQRWLDVNDAGNVKVGADASLLLKSPDESWHRLLVADDGTLSTEPA